jgi:hypothetical protein
MRRKAISCPECLFRTHVNHNPSKRVVTIEWHDNRRRETCKLCGDQGIPKHLWPEWAKTDQEQYDQAQRDKAKGRRR